VFGKETEQYAGSLVKEFGGTKVLVHYGSSSAKKSGLLDRVLASLDANHIPYVLLGGVLPNPRLSKVYEGIELCKKEHVDFILAVGGGSVIDSCKAIGYGLFHEGDVWDFYVKKREIKGCFPIGSVLTLSAAGSEMSDSSVITNEEGWLKRDAVSDFSRCKFSILNPELTYTLPEYQTMCGAVDIMMHTMERYFTAGDHMALTDELAEGLLRTVKRAAYTLKEHPLDYDARANMMWASSLSHNNLTNMGNEVSGDWAPHMIEHELGGMFDVAHGAGLAAVWEAWARYVYLVNPSRFARFGNAVFDLALSKDSKADALATIAAMIAYFKDIKMPTNLSELGIAPTDAQIAEMAKKATNGGQNTIGSFKKLGEADIISILKLALN
jgi:alcohol dehydrogenase YqhD (iron-dependent ADH family)